MKMNRKAMVLAVGAALAAPSAYSQVKSPAGTDWEFYGKFYPELTRAQGSGASAVGTTVSTLASAATGVNAVRNNTEMQINNTYLGFRGSKDLGGGRKAIWQLEQQVGIDEGSDITKPQIANRDSFVGAATNWGTIRLGNMDTPFKKYGDTVGFLGISSGNFVTTSNVMRKVGFGTKSASSFNLRRPNSVMYDSPEVGGLQGAVSFSSGNDKTDVPSSATPAQYPRVLSAAVKYETGPLYLAAAHEIHWDLFGGSNNIAGAVATANSTTTNVNSKDRATQLTAVYKMGIHTFEADINTKKYDEDGTAGATSFTQYKNTAWELVMENRWTNQWRTAFHYIRANKGSCQLVATACDTTGLEGSQLSAGVAYYLDPAFYLFGLYSKLTNGSSAQYNNSSQTPNRGEDITQIAVGLAYTF